MRLIVGLGNPGKEYEHTRHNVGFMALDKIANYLGVTFNKTKFSGSYAEAIYEGEKYILLKPGKYMNLSGEVIRDFVNFFKIDINDIFIIHDDLDTPIGTFRLRYQGGTGGHNGLKNIALNLNTNNYKRMKIGISNDKGLDTKDYVLGKFSLEEQTKLDTVLDQVVPIFKDYQTLTFDNLMNKYNKK